MDNWVDLLALLGLGVKASYEAESYCEADFPLIISQVEEYVTE